MRSTQSPTARVFFESICDDEFTVMGDDSDEKEETFDGIAHAIQREMNIFHYASTTNDQTTATVD